MKAEKLALWPWLSCPYNEHRLMDLTSSVHQSAFCKMSNPRLSFGVEHQLVQELWVLYLAVNGRSCIFSFSRSRMPKTEKYWAFGHIPKQKPNVEIFLNCYLAVIFAVLILFSAAQAKGRIVKNFSFNWILRPLVDHWYLVDHWSESYSFWSGQSCQTEGRLGLSCQRLLQPF